MVNSSVTQVAVINWHSSMLSFVKRLVKEKPLGHLAAVSLILLLVGIFANFLAPYGMNQATATYCSTITNTLVWHGQPGAGYTQSCHLRSSHLGYCRFG